jgi:uncharacterized cupin superfamily protein
MPHEHDWREVSPGYWECTCGATKVVSKQEGKNA